MIKSSHLINSLFYFKVKVQALNDSRLIGICLYNIVILSAVGLGFTLISSDIVVTYTVISLCVIIGTTLTQALVFIPKVSQ